jgi:magnesium chelatase family protein
VRFDDLHAPSRPEDDDDRVRDGIARARRRQEERYGPGVTNGDLSGTEIRRVVRLDRASKRLLASAMSQQDLSARAHDRILKVARTIADLGDGAEVSEKHILEAVQYRKMDRELV